MDVFKDVDVSTWAKVSVPLLAVTITIAFLAIWSIIRRSRRVHYKLTQELSEDPVPSEGLLEVIKSWLWDALPFRREGNEGRWDMKKALREVSVLVLRRDTVIADGVPDPEMGYKAESVGTPSPQ